MNTPEKMFTLDSVDTRVTQPLNQRVIQQGPDTRARDQQMATGVASFSKALGNLATYRKERQIENDISLAQEAAIRNEVMPGGLLPIAQRAFRDTQDIETSNNVYNEIELFTEGEEVRNIVNNPQLTPIQKNSKINKAIDRVYYTSASSIQNVNARINLKSKVDGLKVKGMRDVYSFDKNQKYGVALNALNGQVDEGFGSRKYDPSEIFTGNWVQGVATQLKTALPWISDDDAKLATLKTLTNNENMVNHADVITAIMATEFSKGVTFGALSNSETTEAGIEINKIYTQYLKKVDDHYRTERIDERLAQDELNDAAYAKGSELMDQLKRSGDYAEIDTIDGKEIVLFQDRFKALRKIMIDQTGAEISSYNKFITAYEKAAGYAKNGLDSKEFGWAWDKIVEGEIANTKSLMAFAENNHLSDSSISMLRSYLSEDQRDMRTYISEGKTRLSLVTAGLQTTIRDALKPEDGLMKLIMGGLQNDSAAFSKALQGGKDSQIMKILGKSRLDAQKYISAIRNFATAKNNIDTAIKEEARRALKAGEKPNFDAINTRWERIAQQYGESFEEDIKIIQEKDKEQRQESEEKLKIVREKMAKEKEASKPPEEKAKEKDAQAAKVAEDAFDKEVQTEILEEQEKTLEQQERFTKAGVPNITPEARKELVNSDWIGKDYIPPAVLQWGLDMKDNLPSIIQNKLRQTKDFWMNWPRSDSQSMESGTMKFLEEAAKSPTLFTPLGMQLEEKLKEQNKLKYNLLDDKVTVKESGDQLAKVHDDWNIFSVLKDALSPKEVNAAVLEEPTAVPTKPDDPFMDGNTYFHNDGNITNELDVPESPVSKLILKNFRLKQYNTSLETFKEKWLETRSVIGFLESNNVVDSIQDGAGIGRGKYQYESNTRFTSDGQAGSDSSESANVRMKRDLGIDLGDVVDYSTLSETQQDDILLIDHASIGGSANLFNKIVKATTNEQKAKAYANYWGKVHKKKYTEDELEAQRVKILAYLNRDNT